MEFKTSTRECKYCEEPGFSVPLKVIVAPHYRYFIRKHPDINIDTFVINERFICPNCGVLIVNDYKTTLGQKELQFIVDNLVEK